MPTLNIDGVGKVKIDDSFLTLSPEEQAKTVDEIIAAQGGQPQQAESGNAARSFAGAGLNAVPIVGPALLGGAQRLAAVKHSYLDDVPYEQALQKIQASEAPTQEAHPWASTGGAITGTVGGLMPAMAAAPEAFGIRAAAPWLSRIGTAGTTGAVIGGTDTAARQLAEREATNKPLAPGGVAGGAAVGGLFGAAGPPVGALVGTGARAAMRALPSGAPVTAGRLAGRALTADDLTAQTAAQRLQAMGQAAMPGDLGPNLQTQLRGLASLPGAGQKIVRGALETRAAGASDRVTGYLDRAFGQGKQNVAQQAEDIIKTRSAEARPLYEKALSRPVAWDERLQQFIDDPIVKSGLAKGARIQRLESLAANEPFNPTDYAITGFDEAGNPILGKVPNMRTLNVVKKGIDAMVGERTDPITGRLSEEGRAIDQVRRSFLKKLDEINPDYAAARKAWEGPTKVHERLREGQEVFRRSISPDELQMQMDGMNASEQDAYRTGAQASIAEIMGSARNDATAATRELADKGWNREKLSILLGREKAGNLIDELGLEKGFQDVHQTVTRNSETGRTLAVQKELGAPTSGSFGVREGLMAGGWMGGIRSALMRGGEKTLEKMTAQQKDTVRAELARLLTATGPERDAAIRQIGKALTTQQTKDVIGSRAALAAALLPQIGAQTYRSR